jgi:subtilisin family serine protease
VTALLAAWATGAVSAASAPPSTGTIRDAEWALTALGADRAWQFSKGAGVTVAVVGTGVEASHPDLVGRVVKGQDFGDSAGGDGRRDPGPEGVPGTQIAGIIAGTGRNYRGDGLVGLAPEAKVLPLRVYRDAKPLAAASAKAIRYAVDHGARVIDVSVSFANPSDPLKSAVNYAIGKDAVIIAGAGAAGTTGTRPAYPASYPGVVSVSATDRRGGILPASSGAKNVTLAAPGVDILSTARDGSYWTASGSDYAAAWVAAAAALVRSEQPGWTSGQIVQKLTDTANRKGSAGRDARYGSGTVAPATALADRSTPSTSPGTSAAGRTTVTGQTDRALGAAAPAPPSEDGTGILVLGGTSALLVVLAVISVILIRRHRDPPDAV